MPHHQLSPASLLDFTSTIITTHTHHLSLRQILPLPPRITNSITHCNHNYRLPFITTKSHQLPHLTLLPLLSPPIHYYHHQSTIITTNPLLSPPIHYYHHKSHHRHNHHLHYSLRYCMVIFNLWHALPFQAHTILLLAVQRYWFRIRLFLTLRSFLCLPDNSWKYINWLPLFHSMHALLGQCLLCDLKIYLTETILF